MTDKRKIFAVFAAVAAAAMMFSGCKSKNGTDEQESTTSSETTVSEEETISIYTGREVENPEDLAIRKFNCTVPEGFQAVIDDDTGKQLVSENALIIVKAQNYKDEFTDLATFADQGCAAIKINNMLFQADTEFSEPQNTTVAGFDAIRYDYTITAYRFLYETDENGEEIKDEDGNPIVSDEKVVDAVYKDNIHYFYSDEDVFYVICETAEENAEALAPVFEEFLSSVSITPAK